MIEQICQDAKAGMKKSVEALQGELKKLRTGRAHPSLLDNLMVSYYGTDTALSQVANVVASDSRTLQVTPWEKNMVQPIEKAIIDSDLGLNPATAGTLIRIPMPAMTEDRRKEMTRIVRQIGENSKVSVRNARRDAISQLKDGLKNKELSEDDERRAQDQVQKLTDQFVAEVDKMIAAKEAELMEV